MLSSTSCLVIFAIPIKKLSALKVSTSIACNSTYSMPPPKRPIVKSPNIGNSIGSILARSHIALINSLLISIVILSPLGMIYSSRPIIFKIFTIALWSDGESITSPSLAMLAVTIAPASSSGLNSVPSALSIASVTSLTS